MNVPGCSEGGAVATEDIEGVVGGGVGVVMLVGGVGDEMWVCDVTEGVEGAGWGVRWGVGRRGAGGVRECAIGGVCPSARFTGAMGAM
jgi:hypothetical protein